MAAGQRKRRERRMPEPIPDSPENVCSGVVDHPAEGR